MEFQAIGIAEGRVTDSKARVFVHSRVERGNGKVKIARLVVTLHVSQSFEIGLIDVRCTAGRRLVGFRDSITPSTKLMTLFSWPRT